MNKPNIKSCVKKCSKTVRSSFLNFFADHRHTILKSSPVVPYCDSSIAFVNSGMCQFKDIFLGKYPPTYPRVANAQKCIRVGGKHNDLSSAGRDTYHHTFFEMLGNWSFNDYYKKEACKMALDFLTKPPISLPLQRLYFTYFGGCSKLELPSDEETLNIWLELGVPRFQVIKDGMDTNFWEMGSTGPCGYSTEIHFDLKNDPSSAFSRINKDSPDLIEIWNIVFISYCRLDSDTISPLPKNFIDTGLGFERLVTILQDKHSTYDTDLFIPLLQTICRVSKAKPYSGRFGASGADLDMHYRILSDYSRMITVALADNMFPDATAKLRNIIRDALSISEEIFHVKSGNLIKELSYSVVEVLGENYPEIGQKINNVQKIISEESRIFDNLRNSAVKDWKSLLKDKPELEHLNILKEPGLPLAVKYLNKNLNKESGEIPGDIAFTLYDTYGISKETVADIAAAKKMKLDESGFETLLGNLKQKSKVKGAQSNFPVIDTKVIESLPSTEDHYKYEYRFDEEGEQYVFPKLQSSLSGIVVGETVFFIGENGFVTPSKPREPMKSFFLKQGSIVGLILTKTNMYSDAGGQVDDRGTILLRNPLNREEALIEVENLFVLDGKIIHFGTVDSDVSILPLVEPIVEINVPHRLGCMRAHTAAHVVNEALRKTLTCTYQKSCRVSNDACALDFSVYGETLDLLDIENIEKFVNDVISRRSRVQRSLITSHQLGHMSHVTVIPGEVYPEDLSLVEIADDKQGTEDHDVISREPCCGTHVVNTGHIYACCVVNYKSHNHGVRSIKCLTGKRAEQALENGLVLTRKIKKLEEDIKFLKLSQDLLETQDRTIKEVMQLIKTQSSDLPYVVRKQSEVSLRDLRKTVKLKLRDLAK